ncbi:hypothetical protein WJX73_002721 [Symbiochloris irregularis]|uniref:Protein kinase domain-containing protein n=1 Tax=Symbiochloris irregularis TaxID=706552 RepID=A0AAW1NQN3_9CHLO
MRSRFWCNILGKLAVCWEPVLSLQQAAMLIARVCTPIETVCTSPTRLKPTAVLMVVLSLAAGVTLAPGSQVLGESSLLDLAPDWQAISVDSFEPGSSSHASWQPNLRLTLPFVCRPMVDNPQFTYLKARTGSLTLNDTPPVPLPWGSCKGLQPPNCYNGSPCGSLPADWSRSGVRLAWLDLSANHQINGELPASWSLAASVRFGLTVDSKLSPEWGNDSAESDSEEPAIGSAIVTVHATVSAAAQLKDIAAACVKDTVGGTRTTGCVPPKVLTCKHSLGICTTASTNIARSPFTMHSSSTEGSCSGFSDVGDSLSVGADWHIHPDRLQICKRSNGQDWELGRGGFGQVVKAVLDGKRFIALKMLKLDGQSRPTDDQLHAFGTELAIMAACRHRNVVRFLGGWLQSSGAYICQELCEGGDLSSALERSDSRDRDTHWYCRGKSIALDIARGLEYLHGKHVIHFDIKSNNILLHGSGRACIADVGLAHALTSKTHLSRATYSDPKGTWAYISPEMLTNQQCRVSADIFSFGIVLWEICTGEPSRRGRNRPVLCPCECPQAIADLIAACALEPSSRPSAGQIVQQILASPHTEKDGQKSAAAAGEVVTAQQSSDDQGGLSSQKILAMTGWNQDALENRLAILALEVQCSRDGRVTHSALDTVAEWRHASKATALQVADLRDGRITCIAGCSDGSLYRLQLAMPQYLSADLADMQLIGDDTDGRDLLTWQQHVHSGPVADLDIRGDTGQVVTAGLDGAIHIFPLESQRTLSSQKVPAAQGMNGSHSHEPHVKGSATVSYRAVKWASPNTFNAAGTSGGVEVWDRRSKGRQPSSKSPAAYGFTGCGGHDARVGVLRQIHCLDCHPGQPHLCASGASQGFVAVWDLRFSSAPVCGRLGDSADAGEVWEVRFDVSPGGNSNVLFCTDDELSVSAEDNREQSILLILPSSAYNQDA